MYGNYITDSFDGQGVGEGETRLFGKKAWQKTLDWGGNGLVRSHIEGRNVSEPHKRKAWDGDRAKTTRKTNVL